MIAVDGLQTALNLLKCGSHAAASAGHPPTPAISFHPDPSVKSARCGWHDGWLRSPSASARVRHESQRAERGVRAVSAAVQGVMATCPYCHEFLSETHRCTQQNRRRMRRRSSSVRQCGFGRRRASSCLKARCGECPPRSSDRWRQAPCGANSVITARACRAYSGTAECPAGPRRRGRCSTPRRARGHSPLSPTRTVLVRHSRTA